ncbi:hypothetical protein Bb109J_c1463 [Bdellovibrio bacteriovorus]|nr:hypothetical protein Bb109J_c1463 [Bdellovibrio bacteriovorus]
MKHPVLNKSQEAGGVGALALKTEFRSTRKTCRSNQKSK